jgi:hypothetical protein
MGVVQAVAIGTIFAAFQTVAGTLIAVLLSGVLLSPEKTGIYRAAVLTAAGAIITSVLYQVFDPTFVRITTYIGMSAAERANALYSHMIGPVFRFGVLQIVVDAVFAAFIYQFRYKTNAERVFTVLYSVTKVAFALALWVLLVVPAFAQLL